MLFNVRAMPSPSSLESLSSAIPSTWRPSKQSRERPGLGECGADGEASEDGYEVSGCLVGEEVGESGGRHPDGAW